MWIRGGLRGVRKSLFFVSHRVRFRLAGARGADGCARARAGKGRGQGRKGHITVLWFLVLVLVRLLTGFLHRFGFLQELVELVSKVVEAVVVFPGLGGHLGGALGVGLVGVFWKVFK